MLLGVELPGFSLELLMCMQSLLAGVHQQGVAVIKSYQFELRFLDKVPIRPQNHPGGVSSKLRVLVDGESGQAC